MCVLFPNENNIIQHENMSDTEKECAKGSIKKVRKMNIQVHNTRTLTFGYVVTGCVAFFYFQSVVCMLCAIEIVECINSFGM